MFEGTLTTDAPPASEEKGMSIPVIGSSKCQIVCQSITIILMPNIPSFFELVKRVVELQVKFGPNPISCFNPYTLALSTESQGVMATVNLPL